MRFFVIAVALLCIAIPPLMADPESAPMPEGVQNSAFVPPTPLESFRAPTKDKMALDASANADSGAAK
jgi:hypothetical protein